MLRTVLIDRHNKKKTDLTHEQMQKAIQDPDCMLWVSLEHPTPEEAQSILVDLFDFHPLAVEDCLNTGYQTPKVDDFGSYIFIIAHAIRPNGTLATIETMELNFFLGENYLVTVHLDEKMPPVSHMWEQIERDERLTQNGADFLCHSLLDFLVDDYMPMLDQLDDEIEWLEDQALQRPQTQMLQRILGLKHTLMYLRRIISPQREVLNRLSRDEFPMIDNVSRIYFRDVYDHLVRFQEMTETLRDIVTGALDIYLNSTSLRLNEVMRALTVVSTIFLPLAFVAGVFGMNFNHMFPSWDSPYAYPIFWAICLAVVVGMLVFFKRRGWF
jgi:magnesium transporter